MFILENTNYIERFLSEIKSDHSKSTIIAYKNALDQFENWYKKTTGKFLRPANITAVHMKNFKQYLVDLDRKPNTINKLLAILSAFFNWALANNFVEINPVSSIKNIKQVNNSPKWLTNKEVRALLNVLIRVNNSRNNLIMSLILYAGLQVKELIELKVSDIRKTEDNMFLYISNRKIPVYKTLRLIITNYLNKNNPTKGYLLSSVRSEQLSVRAIQHIIKDYGNKAGIKHLSAITLRHTFGYKLGLTGTDPYTIAALMGYTTADNLPNANSAIQYITDWDKLQKKLEKNMETTIDNLIF